MGKHQLLQHEQAVVAALAALKVVHHDVKVEEAVYGVCYRHVCVPVRSLNRQD
jgi:hypothetical protein